MIPQLDLTRQHAALREELLAAAARVLDSCRFVLGPRGTRAGERAGRLLRRPARDRRELRHRRPPPRPARSRDRAGRRGHHQRVLVRGLREHDPARRRDPRLRRRRAGHPEPRPGAPGTGDHPTDARGGAGAPLRAGRGDGGDRRDRAGRAASPCSPTPPRRWAPRHASRGVGAWGDAACLSFYPTKNVGACGDGGMLLTNRDDLAERARRLRDHGSVRRYEHVELGLSSRLDELQAAFLRVKLVRLPEWNRRRGHIAARYRSLLGGLPVGLPVERAAGRPRVPPVHDPRPRAVTRSPPRSAISASAPPSTTR